MSETLLWAALLSTATALAIDLAPPSVVAWLRVDRERILRRLQLAVAILLVLGLALMAGAFLVHDFSIDYVFSYTRLGYPWYYRLAGLWAGQKGTLLIWTTFTAVFGLLAMGKAERAAKKGSLPLPETHDFLRAMRRYLLTIVGLLTASLLVAGTFDPTPAYMRAARPEGVGLQPVLLTPFMIIHPPIQFLAYALLGVIFSAALAHVSTGRTEWAPIIRPWTRLAWALATLGLGLGGLWAYYVLNFGGFWAWDPVETANLIVWFPVTILLHCLISYREGRYRTAAPLFGLLTLPAALFGTVATRTGLWVSVHAFTDPSKNFAADPFVRLLNILETGPLVRFLTSLFFASFLLALAAVLLGRARSADPHRAPLWRSAILAFLAAGGFFLFLDTVGSLSLLFQVSHWASLGRSAPAGLLLIVFGTAALLVVTSPETHAPPRPKPQTDWLLRWIQSKNILTLGILLLTLSFLVVFLLEMLGVNGYQRAPFDQRAPFLALPILLALGVMFLLPRTGPRKALALAGAAALLGALLAVAAPDHWPVALVAPALLLAGAGSLLRVLHHTAAGSRARDVDRRIGLLLIVGALAGLVHWGNPPARIDLGFAELRPVWWWAVPAYAAAFFALFAGALQRGRPNPRLARPAALLLIPLVGHGVSVLCGVAALALLPRASPGTTPLRMALEERRPALRKASVYLLHVALVTALSGYALATYESHESEPFAADSDGSRAFQGYTFRLLGSRGVGWDSAQGLPEEIHTRVLVLEEGRPLDEVNLVYWLVHDDKPGHYDARVTVLRRAQEDVYLYPFALETPTGTITDHINNARPAADPGVFRLQLTTKVLPGMAFVWTGLWLLVASMAANLAFGGFQISPQRSGATTEYAGPRPAAERAPAGALAGELP